MSEAIHCTSMPQLHRHNIVRCAQHYNYGGAPRLYVSSHPLHTVFASVTDQTLLGGGPIEGLAKTIPGPRRLAQD